MSHCSQGWFFLKTFIHWRKIWRVCIHCFSMTHPLVEARVHFFFLICLSLEAKCSRTPTWMTEKWWMVNLSQISLAEAHLGIKFSVVATYRLCVNIMRLAHTVTKKKLLWFQGFKYQQITKNNIEVCEKQQPMILSGITWCNIFCTTLSAFHMIGRILALSFWQFYLSSLRFAGILFMHRSFKVPAQYFNPVDS